MYPHRPAWYPAWTPTLPPTSPSQVCCVIWDSPPSPPLVNTVFSSNQPSLKIFRLKHNQCLSFRDTSMKALHPSKMRVLKFMWRLMACPIQSVKYKNQPKKCITSYRYWLLQQFCQPVKFQNTNYCQIRGQMLRTCTWLPMKLVVVQLQQNIGDDLFQI